MAREKATVKVLYISPYPPVHDGIGDYTAILASAVRGAGNDFNVVVPFAGPNDRPEVVGAVAAAGLKGSKLQSAIAARKPDVVHVQFAVAAFGSHTMWLMRLIGVIRNKLQIPVVVTLHEATRELSTLRTVGMLIHRWIAKNCDQIVVHTDIAKNTLVEAVGVPRTKITVIPFPGAPRPPATSTTEELRNRYRLAEAKVLLAFGFIHVDKGLDDLVEALHILQGARPRDLDRVRVVIAGTVRPRRGLFRAFELRDRLYLAHLLWDVRRTGLAEVVVLTGYVPDGEVAPWFDLADAVVLPYRRIEQSSVAGLACSLGVPVLASTTGGLAEQLDSYPWTFPARAPQRLAETLAEFWAAKSQGSPEVRAPRPVADLSAVTSLTLDVYCAVVDGNSSETSRVAQT